MESGERYCLLVNADSGVPLFYPNLFITTQVRNASLSFASMESALSSISVLLKFCDERKIDLVERLRSGSFFELNEVDVLADYCQFNLSSKVVANKVTSLAKVRKPRVANETVYRRLSVIAKYIEWLGSLLGDSSVENRKNLEALVKKIRSRRPVKKGRNQSLVEKGLTDEQVDLLFEVFRPESDLNPFEGKSTKVRNRLMFLMLHYLGIRMGELLSIKVKDVDFSNNQIVIARRADEKSDPRVDQPLVKTMDRRIPLKDSLAAEIHNYVMNYRKRELSARKHEYLFVVHKPGPTSGQPVSKATYNKVMTTVKALSPKLIDFTGHALRHKWNERFSLLMDSMDEPPDEAQQEQLRSWLMGWKQGSGTAAYYNQRYIRSKAESAALLLQDEIMTKG
ncbi:tyrosine-type recombinase/integrase [Hydrogenovibrio sp. JE_KL2]|nr:tyrosine-type recombinase/integrase [Hydrogenovibrio sp. JE_KL2]